MQVKLDDGNQWFKKTRLQGGFSIHARLSHILPHQHHLHLLCFSANFHFTKVNAGRDCHTGIIHAVPCYTISPLRCIYLTGKCAYYSAPYIVDPDCEDGII